MTEQRLATWAASVAGASIVFICLGLLLLFGAVFVSAGDYHFLRLWFFWLCVAWFAVYVMSIYALMTLPGKGRQRRLVSWGFATLVHAAIVIYFVLVQGFGSAGFILFGPETIAALLSLAGFTMATRADACVQPGT